MKKTLKLISVLILCVSLALVSSCGIPVPNIGGFANSTGDGTPGGTQSGEPSGGLFGGSGGLFGGSSETPSEEPVKVLTPQEVFVAGAKSYISTDTQNLLSPGEADSELFGLSSEFWDDVNNSSNTTSITASVGNIVSDGEALGETANLSIDLKHNADTGDASVEFSGGAGEDINLSAGIYVKDGVGIIKSPDTDQDIIEYVLPKYGDTSLSGALGAFTTGVLSEDGTATEPDDSQQAREELAAELFDPWMTDTNPEDYTETTEIWTLLGQDVECRVITMTLSGQAAYDFTLHNLEIMNGDEAFSDMNSLFGLDPSSAMEDFQENGENAELEDSASATQQAIDKLEAMSPAEIKALIFSVSTIFNSDEAIGLQYEISSISTRIKMGFLTYQRELEYQAEVIYEDTDGASFSLEASRARADGDEYDEFLRIWATDEEGNEVLKGQYSGTVIETATQLDRQGSFSVDVELTLTEDEPQAITVSGDITSSMTKTDAGYSGSGQVNVAMSAADEAGDISLTLWWKADMVKSDVDITPPMYTSSNVTQVSNLESLSDAMGLDYAEVSSKSKPVQVLSLFGSLIMSSDVTADIGF